MTESGSICTWTFDEARVGGWGVVLMCLFPEGYRGNCRLRARVHAITSHGEHCE